MQNKTLCGIYGHIMPGVDTQQAKSLSAVLGFRINGGEKDGK